VNEKIRLCITQYILSIILGFCGVIFAATNLAQAQQQNVDSDEIERLLNGVFEDIRSHNFTAAAIKSDDLTRTFPDFALGQLLHAELLATLAHDPTLIESDQPFSPALLGLLMEAQSRSRQSVLALDDTRLPDNLLQIGRDIEHVVSVDLEFSRLYLVRNTINRPRIVAHHYAASGRGGYGKTIEGDLRTPTGVYQVTEFKPGSDLPDLYGAGALTLDYPNALDSHYNRTGSGIWLHGVPGDDLSRAPRSSEGCVVMPNDLLAKLRDTLDINSSLVVLSGKLGWRNRQSLEDEKQAFIALFERWRTAWLSNNPLELASLHEQPLAQRASVNLGEPSFAKLFAAEETDIEKLADVSIENVTIIRYPTFPAVRPQTQVKSAQHEQVMMQFAVPGLQRRVTLYWERLADNDWHVVQIKHDPNLI